MSYVKTASTPVAVTKAVAESHRDLPSCPGDRPLKRARLAKLKEVANAGKIASLTWAVARLKGSNQKVRVNGKHTSTTLADPDVYIQPGLTATVDEYECDTPDDLAELYSTFDTREASRTQGEVNQTFFEADPDFAGMESRLLNTLIGAAYFESNPKGARTRRMFAGERAAHALAYKDAFRWVLKLRKDAGVMEFNRKCLRVGVVAAMFATWKASPTAAREFWTAVIKGNGSSDPSHPTRRAERFLLESNLTSKDIENVKTNRRLVVTTEFMAAKLILLFNRFRAGSTMDVRYRVDSDFPTAV